MSRRRDHRHHIHHAHAPMAHELERMALVREMQAKLVAQGFDIGHTEKHPQGIDGIQGNLTNQALDELQQNHPHAYAEITAPLKTHDALHHAEAATPKAQTSATPDVVPGAGPILQSQFTPRAGQAAAPATHIAPPVTQEPSAAAPLPVEKALPVKPAPAKPAPQAIAATPPAQAASPLIDEHTAIFDYKSGSLILPAKYGNAQFAAVSGREEGRNNHAAEASSHIGPVPEGLWNLEAVREHNFHMADPAHPKEHRPGMALSPAAGTNTLGRNHLVVHEVHGAHTTGCIGLTKEDMTKLAALRGKPGDESGITKILVTRDAGMLGYNVAKLAPPQGTPNYQNGWVGESLPKMAHAQGDKTVSAQSVRPSAFSSIHLPF